MGYLLEGRTGEGQTVCLGPRSNAAHSPCDASGPEGLGCLPAIPSRSPVLLRALLFSDELPTGQ